MKFGEFKLDDALGCVLAHTVRAGTGVYKKGTCLGEVDIQALIAAGVEVVTAVRMDVDDIAENEAVEVIADALSAGGVHAGTPVAGRCNIHASHAGVIQVDVESIDLINQSGVGVLVATVRPFEVVEAGRTIATVKVVPYALAKDSVAELVRLADLVPAISVNAFAPMKVGLVLTRVEGQKESLLDKAREVISARLETYGSEVVSERRCAHATDDVAGAVQSVAAQSDMILILGAASTCDAGDVVPTAITVAGGEVEVVGIPVDPGNLLVSGQLNGKAVYGLPGCARSPAMNGVDIVLSRALSGVGVTSPDLLGLGVGGLLSDVAERPVPREIHEDVPSANVPGGVSAVVLAGGTSRRMGVENKLLQNWNAKPLVRHVVDAALASKVFEVVVVTGHDAAAVRQALSGLDVRFVHNPHFGEGLSTSLRAGIGALHEDAAGAAVLLGDMPKLQTATLDALVARFKERGGQAICVPLCGGRRGNPVLWPREFFADILDISGDHGARALIAQFDDRVNQVECDDEGVLKDIDTPADFGDL